LVSKRLSGYQGIIFKLGRPIARGYYKGTQYKETIHNMTKAGKEEKNKNVDIYC
jgi:hypothetical protein